MEASTWANLNKTLATVRGGDETTVGGGVTIAIRDGAGAEDGLAGEDAASALGGAGRDKGIRGEVDGGGAEGVAEGGTTVRGPADLGTMLRRGIGATNLEADPGRDTSFDLSTLVLGVASSAFLDGTEDGEGEASELGSPPAFGVGKLPDGTGEVDKFLGEMDGRDLELLSGKVEGGRECRARAWVLSSGL